MELSELITACEDNDKLPDFYGLKVEIIKRLKEYQQLQIMIDPQG